MGRVDYVVVMSYPTALAQQWMTMMLCMAGAYAALLDPRPDLSVPARSYNRSAYAWWW